MKSWWRHWSPLGMPATATFPLEVYFLCAGSTLTNRLSLKTDDGQHTPLLSSEQQQSVKWGDKVTQNIRTHKLCHTVELHVWEKKTHHTINLLQKVFATGYKNNNNHKQCDASERCLTATAQHVEEKRLYPRVGLKCLLRILPDWYTCFQMNVNR